MKHSILLALVLLITSCSHSPNKSSLGSAGKPNASPVTNYVSSIPTRGIDYGDDLTKIAFGSCANQDQPQPLWKDVLSTQPDLFLFMGDNIYASSPSQQPIADQYRKLDLIPEYRAIREKVPFLATWDDHDYGLRDGGADWPGKASARKDFMNYWLYAKNTIPLEQTGIYHAKIIGPKKRAVQIIMLDTRSYRSPLKELPSVDGKPGGYEASHEGTILGESQWEWLEAQLKRPADLRLIVSSIQVIADEPPFEKWANFPKERQRLFELLKKTRTRNAVILSGDRHSASISKISLKGLGDIYDITASSINRPHDFPDTDNHYIGAAYNKENFGLANIDWGRKVVKFEIFGAGLVPANKVEFKFR